MEDLLRIDSNHCNTIMGVYWLQKRASKPWNFQFDALYQHCNNNAWKRIYWAKH